MGPVHTDNPFDSGKHMGSHHNMQKPLILITEPEQYSRKALDIYESVGRVMMGLQDGRGNVDRADVFALVVRLGHNLNPGFLAPFKNLKYIISPTTGITHIDTRYCDDRNIRILTLKGEVSFLDSVTATSELTIGLILSLVRNIPAARRDVIENLRWDRDPFKGRELNSLRLGLLGLGRLGRQTARFAKAFGMAVNAHDPNVPDSAFSELGVDRIPTIIELFRLSNILSVHVAYSPENRRIIGETELNALPKGAYLINTSRGEIIDEKALLAALKSGRLAGAALDVLDGENEILNLGEHPLIKYARGKDNLIITPHIGGCARDSMERTEIFMAGKFRDMHMMETGPQG